ncbi:MAG: hypothetical protein HFH84_05460 [Lachnospiraceae bacterium]|nr:hypothetical protein [Lachnospiraceae bacterium]
MGSYYRHRKTESVDVPYSFRCEQCMKDSGTLKATITGMEAEMNSNFKTLNEKNQKKLDELAHDKLVREVKEVHRNATEKQIYSKVFKDECPYCHKPQSWAISGAKDDMFSTPIVCVILGIIIGGGCYFFSGVENNLTIALVAAGICLVLAAGSLIINMIKIGNKKKQTATVVQKNVPVIEWDAVDYILYL